MKLTLKEINKSWYFTGIVIIMYFLALILNPKTVLIALQSALSTFIKILPVFVLVFVLMALTNYFIEPKKMVKWLNKKQGWLIAIVAGIISAGPIYMWYPLLNDLQKQGIKNGLIATFLYNRAIKIPLLPMIILYFGLAFTVVLTVVMAVLSILQGWIVEKITS